MQKVLKGLVNPFRTCITLARLIKNAITSENKGFATDLSTENFRSGSEGAFSRKNGGEAMSLHLLPFCHKFIFAVASQVWMGKMSTFRSEGLPQSRKF